MASLLEDLLDPDLSVETRKIVIGSWYTESLGDFTRDPALRSRTTGRAKNLIEFYSLVGDALTNYQEREGIAIEDRVRYSEEEPDIDAKTESIVLGLVKRQPGAFGKGQPFESNVLNLRPTVREVTDDKENPGYQLSTLGYVHDNIIRFICWARTNKAANRRAMWFEKFMDEYTWWFRLQGTKRVIFWGRNQDITLDISGNKWYGRPLDYYVATEDISVYSQKKVEEIVLNLLVTNS